MDRCTSSLTRKDWLEAGQALLRSAGISGLKLRPLAQRLGISTGSFYHHFADFDTYLGALASYYGGEQLQANLTAAKAASNSPQGRILAAAKMTQDQALPELILAMRAWARSDPRALAAVRMLDETLIGFLSECLREAGFSPDEAVTRAYVLLASASADVPAPAVEGGPRAMARRIIGLVCAPPPPERLED